MLELHQSWLSAWRGISSTTDGEDTYAAVIARYREPHRRYHTLQHLGECLGLFKIARSLSFCAAEVEVALWFHDAIYDVKRSDNEEQSAEWAKTAIVRSGASVEAATLVHSLVMVTKHTRMPRGPEEQLLVDIDLSVLGSNKERFAEYERQIREEYAHVPDLLFKRRRREILASFLDRPRIYSTTHFYETLEASARANLRFAIGENAA